MEVLTIFSIIIIIVFFALILYLITFLHLLHLFVGLISLLVTLKNSIKGKYSSENTHGIELCSIYWHFLDILWVYLFLFLYYIR